MLRRQYGFNSQLKIILEKFELGDSKFVDVKSFNMLTPDSFLWRLRMIDLTYYLYAGDYFPNLQHVRKIILAETDATEGEFVKVKTVERTNEFTGEFLEYVISDEYDKVALFKSTLSGEYDE